MREVHLSAEAEDDLSSALEWYGARGKTLEFLREIERAIEAIEDNFEQFPVVHKTARRALVKHFPYAIFLWSEGKRSRLSPYFTSPAILHYGKAGLNDWVASPYLKGFICYPAKRLPGIWQNRWGVKADEEKKPVGRRGGTGAYFAGELRGADD